MAIIIEKQSKCPICGNFLDDTEEYIMVPPLISNTKDELFTLIDTGIHKSCLNKSALKHKLLKHIDLYDKHLPPSMLKCYVGGKTIDSPHKLLYFGLLTSDETEELYNFNYLSFNINNVPHWKGVKRFLLTVNEFVVEGKWGGFDNFNKLEYLAERISWFHGVQSH